jgi:hypothetical protein
MLPAETYSPGENISQLAPPGCLLFGLLMERDCLDGEKVSIWLALEFQAIHKSNLNNNFIHKFLQSGKVSLPRNKWMKKSIAICQKIRQRKKL